MEAAIVCSCPEEWQGSDCREPVCEQQCKNGGYCALQYMRVPYRVLGFDCSWPVCTQDGFEAWKSQINRDALDGIGDERSDTYLRGSNQEYV